MRTLRSLLLILFLPAAACDKSEKSEMPAASPIVDTAPTATDTDVEPEPADKPLTREEVGEDTLVMLTTLVEIAETHKGDCAKTSAGFRETFAAHRETLDAGKKMESIPADQLWFEENYSYKFNNQAMLMREHLGACMSDPEFQNAMAEMN